MKLYLALILTILFGTEYAVAQGTASPPETVKAPDRGRVAKIIKSATMRYAETHNLGEPDTKKDEVPEEFDNFVKQFTDSLSDAECQTVIALFKKGEAHKLSIAASRKKIERMKSEYEIMLSKMLLHLSSAEYQVDEYYFVYPFFEEKFLRIALLNLESDGNFTGQDATEVETK